MIKKLLSLAMLALLMISVLNVLNVNIVNVSAVSPAITFAPANQLKDQATAPKGTVFNWPISTDYSGSDLWGYEFSITYNPVVLEVLQVINGDRIVNATGDSGARFLAGSIDNDVGELSVTTAYFDFISPPPNMTSGPGTLATVQFNVTGDGDSDITFGAETKLVAWNTSAVESYNIIDLTSVSGSIVDGYFENMDFGIEHNVRINSVSADKTWCYSRELVDISVVAENTGNVTEKFDVTAYYSTVDIETKTIELAAETTSGTLHFIWNTTIARGNLSISVEASNVGSAYVPETSTTDNTLVDGNVIVKPPIIAVENSTGGIEFIDTTLTGGDTFDVNITITDAYLLDRFVFNLTWNVLQLEAVYILPGDFFDGHSPNLDVINSTSWWAQMNFTGTSKLTGNGTLAEITFRVVTKGGSLIELEPFGTWWTEQWATTPVVINGVHSNYFDMTFHTGNFRWVLHIYNYQIDWVYPTFKPLYRIVVNPKNNGYLHMSYTMTIYINGVAHESRVLTLVGKQHSPDNKRTYTFDFNVTGLSYGTYSISANITQQDPPLDADSTNDNFMFGSPTTVRIPGDTNGDANVNPTDWNLFAGLYGLTMDHPQFDIAVDLDADGDVDPDDFNKFTAKYTLNIGSYPTGTYP
jgi:hypothetical protein